MRIDVHAHLWTDAYLDLLQRLGRTDVATQRGRGAGPSDGEIAARFALMDRAGVELQILSTPPQVPHFERKDAAVAAARAANDAYAAIVERWPNRFRAFASIPLPHVDESLREIARALDEQRLVGVAITTSILGRSVADPVFIPIYEELNRRGFVLYVHPEGCGARTPLVRDHHMTWMVGAPLEDTIAIAHMIVSGIPLRFPELRIINSHLGGALPMLLQRLDNQYRWRRPRLQRGPAWRRAACGTTPLRTPIHRRCAQPSKGSAQTGSSWAPTFLMKRVISSSAPSSTSATPVWRRPTRHASWTSMRRRSSGSRRRRTKSSIGRHADQTRQPFTQEERCDRRQPPAAAWPNRFRHSSPPRGRRPAHRTSS
jgi:aminocarboxymuconate-semialdehyde decarboxylase